MSKRVSDPRRLDVEAFAEAAAELSGEWSLFELSRLAETADGRTADGPEHSIHWRARGERRKSGSDPTRTWLHLSATTEVPRLCQRCLHPVSIPIEVKRSFMFVHGEQAAAELDEESEDDVLALTRSLDLREFVEDEVLLALPLVPKHERCPQPLQNVEASTSDSKAPHPFAALASLKQGETGQS
jgi:uncharacterized protein